MNSTPNLTVLVDVDQVVADLHSEWLRRYNEDYRDALRKEDITAWNLDQFTKEECGRRIYDYLHDEDLYDDVKPIPGALEGVRTLRGMGHRVVFVTSATPATMGQKHQWLHRHGFLTKNHPRDYVVAHDKSLVRGDVLIDDGPHNINAFPGFGIVFDAPYNRKTTIKRRYPDDYVRSYGWTREPYSVLDCVRFHMERTAPLTTTLACAGPAVTTGNADVKERVTTRAAIDEKIIASKLGRVMDDEQRRELERECVRAVTKTIERRIMSGGPDREPGTGDFKIVTPDDKTVMAEAEGLIYGDRNASYGHPKENFDHTAALWNAHFKTDVFDAEGVADAMTLVKLSRDRVGTGKRDNIVDAIGYQGCKQRIRDREAGVE